MALNCFAWRFHSGCKIQAGNTEIQHNQLGPPAPKGSQGRFLWLRPVGLRIGPRVPGLGIVPGLAATEPSRIVNHRIRQNCFMEFSTVQAYSWHILSHSIFLKYKLKYIPFVAKEKYAKMQNKRFQHRTSYVMQWNTWSSMLYVGHKDIPICVQFYTVSCKLHEKCMITDSHQLSFLF